MAVGRWAGIRDGAVLFEDEAVLVLNKPAGVSVMGERHESDLVRLAEEDGETLFPVHRIDKVTSGAVLFAKELRFHGDLTRQFGKRTVEKAYLAVVRADGGLPERGVVDLPLGVGRKNRVRVAGRREDIVRDEERPADSGTRPASRTAPRARRWSLAADAGEYGKKSYPSVTEFARVWEDERHALLAVRPVTGRRHQIRVHLAWTGHAIEGDPLFDKESAARGARTCLHAWRLAFDAAWADGRRIAVEAAPGADFWTPLAERAADASAPEVLARARDAVTGRR
ncbi:RluA family pseudouridine synthase [Streptomyces sp. TRM 70351]|uniref:RluA family pseudouridine synthase n=1 Tax=Streptomyces sp. TRM 70351 TaxID=3116552 RepID=UPI002E7B626E|nr:RluA family pseudouridine synthase [Streptomyces sp. TRM 70351]MEE1929519.1 RluA family pseudouridine synthase [Streptomyces sp. TRM 70351]